MRTTLTLDDDVYAAARSVARAEGKSLGAIVSRLVRQGLAPRRTASAKRGRFPVFTVRRDAPAITTEMVRRALDET
jgi:hypothetical protein